jgi:hypothetical protein
MMELRRPPAVSTAKQMSNLDLLDRAEARCLTATVAGGVVARSTTQVRGLSSFKQLCPVVRSCCYELGVPKDGQILMV